MHREDLIKSIHSGVRAACKEYGKWSGGESIHDRGIESLLVSSVARKIVKGWKAHSRTAYLSLETPFSEVAENSYSIPKMGPRPKVLRGNRRADLVLWNSAMKVSGVIEVKRKWSPGSCHHDLKRLRGLVKQYGCHHEGTVQMGFLVTLVVVEKSKFEGRVGEIKESVGAIKTDDVSVRVHPDHLVAYEDTEQGKTGYSMVIEVVPKRPNGGAAEHDGSNGDDGD
jgi:hypothetical protein